MYPGAQGASRRLIHRHVRGECGTRSCEWGVAVGNPQARRHAGQTRRVPKSDARPAGFLKRGDVMAGRYCAAAARVVRKSGSERKCQRAARLGGDARLGAECGRGTPGVSSQFPSFFRRQVPDFPEPLLQDLGRTLCRQRPGAVSLERGCAHRRRRAPALQLWRGMADQRT
jgi:hypothetical protein